MVVKQIDQNDDRFRLLDRILFPAFDPFFAKNLNRFFFISVVLTILFGLLLFDVRISEGGDDSSYLLEAMKFSRGESFPSFHGAFYSVMIGWLISLFGFHLIFFKSLSFFFLIGHQFFLFFAFRKLISPFLLSIILLIVSINSGIIYYGSQTYTEAFYMMLQSILFYLLLNHLISKPNDYRHFLSSWKQYLGLGLILFLLSTTRNIGIVALLAVVLYYILEKKYWPALFSLTGFLLFVLPYNVFKRLVWNVRESDLNGQFSIVLQKDPYNRTLGNETLAGMIERIFDNANIYLSRIFLQETGLKSSSYTGTSFILTLLISIIILTGIILAYRSDRKFLRPVFLYVILTLGATFVSLSQMWSQARIMIIMIPLLLLSISWALAELGKFEILVFTKAITIIFLALIFSSTGIHTIRKVKNHRAILKRNLAGDTFYGFTPDMRNYLAISQWAAENIPENVKIGARKASMSFVYGNGREFYPIYKVPFTATHEILDSVRILNQTAIFINDLDLKKKSRGPLLYMKKNLSAVIAFNDAVYSMFTFKSSTVADSLIKILSVPAIHGVDQFRVTMADELRKSTTAFVPDRLLNELKANNVHYLIDASLRNNPLEKSDKQINTVKRYMIAIISKYPGIFTMVKQIGDNDDEPAWLFKINYDKYK